MLKNRIKNVSGEELVGDVEIDKDKCEYCKNGIPHMIVVMSKSGNIHVHAPFSNDFLMSKFSEAIITEQKKNKI